MTTAPIGPETWHCRLAGHNPASVIAKCLRNAPSDRQLLDGPKPLTYGAAASLIQSARAQLQDRGLTTGHRVVLALRDDRSTVVAFLALMASGITISTFDPDAPLTEATDMLRLIKPHGVVTDADIAEAWRQGGLLGGAEPVVLSPSDLLVTSDPTDSTPISTPDVTMASPMMILYTSGTTAKPKGVILSYRAMLEQSLDMADHTGVSAGSRVLNLFRFYQIGSIVNGLMLALLNGATLCRPYPMVSRDHAIDLLRYIETKGTSHFVLVPTFLAHLMQFQDQIIRSMSGEAFRAVISTAAYLPDPLWQEFEKATGKPIVNTFGLTEANDITATAASLEAGRHGTIGRFFDGQFKIIDGDGNTVAPGTEGELVVAGKTVMDGYFDDPDLTAKVLSDGWFKTGDVAVENADGSISYIGRATERIISGGHTVHPSEVATALLEHPDIADAYVFGDPHPQWGELVACCVTRARTDLTKPEIVGFLRERLSPYKIPRKIHFLDVIPTSDRGKVRRRDILDLVARQS